MWHYVHCSALWSGSDAPLARYFGQGATPRVPGTLVREGHLICPVLSPLIRARRANVCDIALWSDIPEHPS